MHPGKHPSSKSLEEKLRSLPQPPLPPGLETRLLMSIPVPMSSGRRWPALAALMTLTAACLLLMVSLPGRDQRRSVAIVRAGDTPPSAGSAAPPEPQPATAWRPSRFGMDDPPLPAFHWPISETTALGASTPLAAVSFD